MFLDEAGTSFMRRVVEAHAAHEASSYKIVLSNEERGVISKLLADVEADAEVHRGVVEEVVKDPAAAAARIKQLEEQNIAKPATPTVSEREQECKVCLDDPRECVFIPCGHILCCAVCAAATKKCPLCGQKILQVVRIAK